MRYFIIAFVVFVTLMGGDKSYAYCDGWYTGSGTECSSDPYTPGFNACQKLWEDNYSIWSIPIDFEMIKFKDISHKSPNGEPRYEWACLYYRASVGPESIVGGHEGNTIYSMCVPPKVRDTNHPSNCILRCDNPSVNREFCPPQEEDNVCKQKTDAPINFVTGKKLFNEVDYQTNGLFPLEFVRYYNSQNGKEKRGEGGWISPSLSDEELSLHGTRPTPFLSEIVDVNSPYVAQRVIEYEVKINGNTSTFTTPALMPRSVSLANTASVWRHTYEKSLFHVKKQNDIILYRPNGDELWFSLEEGSLDVYLPRRQKNRGKEIIYKEQDGFRYINSQLEEEVYSKNGQFILYKNKQGYQFDLTYDQVTHLLYSVTDSLGRSLIFFYDDNNRLEQMVTPGGHVYQYEYLNPGSLLFSKVFYPDADSEPLNNPFRTYAYLDSRFPNAITHIYDGENGVSKLFGAYTYDAVGRAILSELANNKESTSVDYSVTNQRTVTNALGKKMTYYLDANNNITDIEGEPSTNCAGSSRDFSYDSNNFKISETDKNGNVTTYIRDADGRETSRTEASGTPLARTIETEWHSTLNVKTKITEPDRITHFTYDTNGLLLNKSVAPNPAP